ncbi:MAG: ATP-binding cassette domain-containing protein [Caldisericaceae bacterium]
MIEFQNVFLTYDPFTRFKKEALVDVNLSIDKGESVAVVGQIGSGKSTLVQLMNGLIKPDKGLVLLNGEDINSSGFPHKEVIRNVGVVFQYPEEQFFAENVYEEVAFGPRNLGFSEAEVEQSVYRALAIMGFSKRIAKRSPFELSGGEKRRVAIASVISMKPKVLVLDEPTAGMDYIGTKSILSHIAREVKEGTSVIFVTHNMDEALLVSERIIALQGGRIIFDGKTRDFFSDEELVLSTGLNVPFAVNFRKIAAHYNIDLPFVRSESEIVQALMERYRAKE